MNEDATLSCVCVYIEILNIKPLLRTFFSQMFSMHRLLKTLQFGKKSKLLDNVINYTTIVYCKY